MILTPPPMCNHPLISSLHFRGKNVWKCCRCPQEFRPVTVIKPEPEDTTYTPIEPRTVEDDLCHNPFSTRKVTEDVRQKAEESKKVLSIDERFDAVVKAIDLVVEQIEENEKSHNKARVGILV